MGRGSEEDESGIIQKSREGSGAVRHVPMGRDLGTRSESCDDQIAKVGEEKGGPTAMKTEHVCGGGYEGIADISGEDDCRSQSCGWEGGPWLEVNRSRSPDCRTLHSQIR